MRAVLLRGHGGPEQLEYREDVPVPAPAAGEVRLRVAAAAVNNTDVNLRIGWYSRAVDRDADPQAYLGAATAEDAGWAGDALAFPRIQGADACGYVDAVGAGVDPGRVGERVLVDPIIRSPSGPPRYLGSDIPGTFAEFVCVPADNAVPIASDWSDAELASFPCSYLAAENLLTRAAVGAGEAVLITGASGGVGSAAVQLARRRGARAFALAGSSKSAALEALGAARVLARDADLVAVLGEESLDAVVDVVGGSAFPSLLAILRRGGRYAVAGAIAGPIVRLDLRTVYLKDLSLLGCTIPAPGLFSRLVGYIERREIRPVVGATYPLRDLASAQAAFQAKAHVGKIAVIL